MCYGKGVSSHARHGCMPFGGKDFHQLMHKFGRHMKECFGRIGSWVPYNLEKTEGGYLITVPLPGRSMEDVNVSLIGNCLNVKASKPKNVKEPKEEKEKQGIPFLRHFFSFIDVDLDIELPADADLDSIKSIMTNGLLKVKIGRKPSKTININTEENN
ncbi:MAG: Hsp20/alpha crystallin family protein [Candidatus Hodarchaeota archaeon]